MNASTTVVPAEHPLAPSGETIAPDGEAEREYRSLLRKWWFGAAVGVPTMFFSYPWIFPFLQDWLPRESDRLRAVWAVLGIFALAVLAYSGSQFFTGAWRALRHRQANMHRA